MAKFFGKIGYGISEETKPGVWKKRIVEREYFGDLVRNIRRLETGSQVNDNINIANDISIVADPFAYENFRNMLWVEFNGAKWRVSSIEVQYPRLILSVGGLYNGQKQTGAP